MTRDIREQIAAMADKRIDSETAHVERPVEKLHAHATKAVSHQFKGYTLEELRLRKVVNDMKIEAAKERLTMMVSTKFKRETTVVSNGISGFDNLMKYYDIAMMAYGVVRRIISFFARFSSRR